MPDFLIKDYTQKTSNDCFRCCLAALLGLPFSGVPNFTEENNGMFWERINNWLNERNLILFKLPFRDYYEFKGVYLVSGLSPRAGMNGRNENLQHMVLMQNGKIILDPHPLRDGLKTREFIYILSSNGPLLTVKFKKEDFGDLFLN